MSFSSHNCFFHIFVNHTPVSSISSNHIRLLPIHTQFQSIPLKHQNVFKKPMRLSSGSNYLFAACMNPPFAMADPVLQYNNLESQLLINRPIPRMLQTLLDSHLTGSRSCRWMNRPVAEACKNILSAHVLDNFIVAFNEQSFASVRTSLPFFYWTCLPKF
jgi:hypothetical protein